MIVLYDGWPIVYSPNSPATMHLLALLAFCPEEFKPHLALPGAIPDWLQQGVHAHAQPVPRTAWGRLRWEQGILPGLARHLGAKLLHLTLPGAALFGRAPSVFSPSDLWEEPGGPARENEVSMSDDFSEEGVAHGVIDRMRRSLGQGGLARARGLIWPSDLPLPTGGPASIPIFQLPPAVHPSFTPPTPFAAPDLSALDLPETYVLYHGPCSLPALRQLLNAWSWASNAIGEEYPLVIMGSSAASLAQLDFLLKKDILAETVRPLPPVPPLFVAEIYRGCAALFHPMPISPWGSPVRHALACGRPVVAAENHLTNALVGPAAYLAPEGDARTLGAALVTVLVEEQVADQIIRAGQPRAAAWKAENFTRGLREVYLATGFSS